jgi:hypothetical protein
MNNLVAVGLFFGGVEGTQMAALEGGLRSVRDDPVPVWSISGKVKK